MKWFWTFFDAAGPFFSGLAMSRLIIMATLDNGAHPIASVVYAVLGVGVCISMISKHFVIR